MFHKHYTVKINLPGGIVAAGDLYAVAEAGLNAKVEDMQLGGRQQLYCKVADRYGEEFLRALDIAGIFYETDKEFFPNIISSYVTEGVFGKSSWVSEGLYKDILQAFDFRPRLKINLVDIGQSFVPFLTGHLNFISGPVNNHWHLVIRDPGTNRMHTWPTGIYSPDIPSVCRAMEGVLLEGSGDTKRAMANFREGPVLPEMRLPPFQLPYYEGFNRAGSKSWLGIYRREELFPVAFLREVALLALQTKNGQLYTTPWKSLLIKDIEDADLSRWEYVLGKYRMNVRHASNELNWQIEDLCPDGLRLKRYLVRLLDQDDVRTEGLSFTIKTRKGSGLAGSVVIRLQDGGKPGQHKVLDRYTIGHTEGFDAHARESLLYRKDLGKEHLFPYLVSLCKAYYEQQNEQQVLQATAKTTGAMGSESYPENISGFQCRHCLTLYDEGHGDPEQAIAPGTPFGSLGEEYVCPVCGAPKMDFAASIVTLGG